MAGLCARERKKGSAWARRLAFFYRIRGKKRERQPRNAVFGFFGVVEQVRTCCGDACLRPLPPRARGFAERSEKGRGEKNRSPLGGEIGTCLPGLSGACSATSAAPPETVEAET